MGWHLLTFAVGAIVGAGLILALLWRD